MTGQWDLGNYYILGGRGRVINTNTVPILNGIQARAKTLGYQVVYDGSNDVERSLSVLNSADVGIICGGTTSTEGKDRKSLFVDQEDFISQVLQRKKKPLVVALSTPGAFATPWSSSANAIVNMFLAGQETGNAWADILFGDVNPSGRLPVTVTLNGEGTIDPCNSDRCSYTERLNVGYRGMQGGVAFPFGHGLSYTTFLYSWVKLPSSQACKPTDLICMVVGVKNS